MKHDRECVTSEGGVIGLMARNAGRSDFLWCYVVHLGGMSLLVNGLLCFFQHAMK